MEKFLRNELVSFTTKDGLILHGLLARPGSKVDSAMIYLHGLEGTFYRSNSMKVLARSATRKGIALLSIENRGSYTALGIRRKNGRNPGWLSAGGGFERFEDCVHDIDGAIKFLGRLGIRKIILVGHSTGCQKITYYQYKRNNRKVKSLVLLAPGDDYNVERHMLGRRFDEAIRDARKLYKKDRSALMPKRYVKRSFSVGRFLSFSDLRFVEARLFNYESGRLAEFGRIRQPILAVFGSNDEHALKPVREYMRILERDTNSKRFDYAMIRNADHGFSGKEEKTARVVVDWLKELL